MADAPGHETHPSQVVRLAVAEFGADLVVDWYADLMTGRCLATDPDRPPIGWAAGHTRWKPYWARTWGARGLLYVWDDRVGPDVVAALSDEHWRVREMAAKLVRRHEVGPAAEDVAELIDDPVERVRLAAIRALARVGEGEHFDALEHAVADPNRRVSAAASMALDELAGRLDRLA